MNIRLINLETDKPTIDAWCKERQLNIFPNKYFSKYGFIVSKQDKDLAACWLYPLSDTERCLMDCMIATPNSTIDERDEAISLLILTMTLSAKDMGYKYIACNTTYKTIKKHLLNLNFTEDKNLQTYFTGEL